MAFATVVAVNATHDATQGATIAVALPVGVNVVGRRVLVFVSRDNVDVGALGWPATWTTITNATFGGDGGTPDSYHEVRYHDVTGSEGWVGNGTDTINITSVNRELAARSWCISGHDAATAPEAASATGSASQAADPPPLTPSWGALDTLWIAMAGSDNNGLNTWTGFPANYPGNQHADYSSGNASSVGHATAERSLNAASEDPAAFTYTSTNETWRAITLAIKPAAGAGWSLYRPYTLGSAIAAVTTGGLFYYWRRRRQERPDE